MLWCLVLALAAGLLAAGYRYLDDQGYLEVFKSTQALQDYVEGFGVWAPLAFILLQLIQVIVAPIPGNVTTLAGGALFGFLPAFLYSTLGGLPRLPGRPLASAAIAAGPSSIAWPPKRLWISIWACWRKSSGSP